MNNQTRDTVCYCSAITKGEIKEAVDNGCSTINEVRDYLDKHTTGQCMTMNPTGQCCHKDFQKVIDCFLKS